MLYKFMTRKEGYESGLRRKPRGYEIVSCSHICDLTLYLESSLNSFRHMLSLVRAHVVIFHILIGGVFTKTRKYC